jgi:hypothetical protein
MDLIICSVVRAKRAGDCSKSVAGGGRRAASLLSTDIMVVVYKKAVWLRLSYMDLKLTNVVNQLHFSNDARRICKSR